LLSLTSLEIARGRPLPSYASALEARARQASILRPPVRQTVSRSAEQVRYVNNPGGGYVGPWRNTDAPYLVAPADTLTSRLYSATVFVGPAQSIKTDGLILNWIAHTVVNDPADMIIYEKSQTAARDFTKRRLDRLNRDSKKVGARLGGRRSDDNIFDKVYRGMLLTLSWPSINELSGRPIPRVALTDYDRMPRDIDGEGEPFPLARKRTTSFGSAGHTLAESSPGCMLPREAAEWKCPEGSHEAPPAPGILGLYNQGTRHRWYWPCPHCNEFFEGRFSHLRWDERDPDPATAADSVFMVCPACGAVIEPKHKATMNALGTAQWVGEGQTIDSRGVLSGLARRSDTASFWLFGPAAALQSWRGLVFNYLTARRAYESTGDEEALKTTVNVDQAEAYLSQAMRPEAGALTPDMLKSRAEDYPVGRVPPAARFLVAAVDIGVRSFIVQVRAIGPGGEAWIIDRFNIFISKRADANGEPLPVDPATYKEDWELLEQQVVLKAYPLADMPERSMRVTLTVVDSAGADGVTSRAYDFWRLMKTRGHASRVRLCKGEDGGDKKPRVVETYPDSQRKDRNAGARGEIPVLLINVDRMKDMAHADLKRQEPGPGYVHLSKHLPDEVIPELLSEVKTPKGWERKPGQRAEALDLDVYARAGALKLGVEKIDWENPPAFAAPRDSNPLVTEMVIGAAGPERRSGAPQKKTLAQLLP
jgi:phage terminase large subunit GpA-like protein